MTTSTAHPDPLLEMRNRWKRIAPEIYGGRHTATCRGDALAEHTFDFKSRGFVAMLWHQVRHGRLTLRLEIKFAQGEASQKRFDVAACTLGVVINESFAAVPSEWEMPSGFSRVGYFPPLPDAIERFKPPKPRRPNHSRPVREGLGDRRRT